MSSNDCLSALAAAGENGAASRVALVSRDLALSFAELGARVAGALAALHTRGVGLGTRVALVAASRTETVVVLLALMEARAVIVPIHPRLTAAESAAIVAASSAALTLDALAVGELARAEARPLPREHVAGTDDDPLAIVFTSGTSGAPKGVVLSRAAFCASALASAERLGFSEPDRWLACMPLAHVGGLGVVSRCLVARRPIVIEEGFDPERVLQRIARGEATMLSAVPTMLEALLDRDREGVLAKLRVVLVGGAAASPSLLARAAARRVAVRTTYGLTEACSQVTVQSSRDPATLEAGSGTPLRGVDVAILGADGDRARTGDVGRIAVNGPTLFLGYDRGPSLPPASDRARVEGRREPFFDTGDLGFFDDAGRLHVEARRSDLIVTGGENVSPTAVEHFLEGIDGVRRALVFGLPDPRWGQVVAAVLELDPRTDVARVLERCEAELASHKQPRRIAVLERIELGKVGKVDRASAVARYGERVVDVRSLKRARA